MSLQPCSSSPISRRRGSLDSVVLPVPDRPKKSAVSPVVADVRRAVHRHDALQRQRVVEDREDRLLDLAGVVRSADQHELAAEVHEDEYLRARAVLGGVGLELREIDDRELRPMRRPLRRVVFRQEHVPGKQVVPGELVHDANRHAVRRVGAAPGVEHEELLVLRVGHHVAVNEIELRFLDRLVDRAPVHVLFALRFADDKLVVG